MGVWLSKASWATTSGAPDARSFGLICKGAWAFTLERGYLHVYVWQKLTVRLGLSLLSLSTCVTVLASSVPCFVVSYKDV